MRSRLPNTIRQNSTQTNQSLQSAQKSAERALEGAKKMSGDIGNRLAGMLGCEYCKTICRLDFSLISNLTAYREPVMYNLAVTREVLKQVYVREGLAPPTSFSTVTEAYSALWSRAKNPQYWNEIWRTGEWAKVAIYGLEAYFIFNIGEMVGRMNLIGYDLD
jgi:F-type H+-transporting ATPase subunit g